VWKPLISVLAASIVAVAGVAAASPAQRAPPRSVRHRCAEPGLKLAATRSGACVHRHPAARRRQARAEHPGHGPEKSQTASVGVPENPQYQRLTTQQLEAAVAGPPPGDAPAELVIRGSRTHGREQYEAEQRDLIQERADEERKAQVQQSMELIRIGAGL